MISHAFQSVQSARSPTDVLAVNCFYMAVGVINSCIYLLYSQFCHCLSHFFSSQARSSVLPRGGYKAAAYSSFGVGVAELQGGDKIIINQLEVIATMAFVPILLTLGQPL